MALCTYVTSVSPAVPFAFTSPNQRNTILHCTWCYADCASSASVQCVQCNRMSISHCAFLQSAMHAIHRSVPTYFVTVMACHALLIISSPRVTYNLPHQTHTENGLFSNSAHYIVRTPDPFKILDA